MEADRVTSILESLIFVSVRPLPFQKLVELLPGVTPESIRTALHRLKDDCFHQRRGLSLVEVAGGFQLRTKPENAEAIRSFLRSRPQRMSRPTLETISIVAYRQPITRVEIEAIRGVDAGGVLATLLERKLIQIMGRKDVPGRPFVYGTTKEFLEFFGLKDLASLPSLKELEELGANEPLPGSQALDSQLDGSAEAEQAIPVEEEGSEGEVEA